MYDGLDRDPDIWSQTGITDNSTSTLSPDFDDVICGLGRYVQWPPGPEALHLGTWAALGPGGWRYTYLLSYLLSVAEVRAPVHAHLQVLDIMQLQGSLCHHKIVAHASWGLPQWSSHGKRILRSGGVGLERLELVLPVSDERFVNTVKLVNRPDEPFCRSDAGTSLHMPQPKIPPSQHIK